MSETTTGFELVRELAASPERVWSAWTNPEEMSAWFHPRGLSTPRESVTVDLRVGGKYTYTMVHDLTGDAYPTGGVYLAIHPYELLEFTWGSPDADPATAPVVTVRLQGNGDRTRMTFTVRGLDGAPGDGSFYDGWDSALHVFADYVHGAGV